MFCQAIPSKGQPRGISTSDEYLRTEQESLL